MPTKNTSKSKSASAPKSAAVAPTKAKDLPANKNVKGGWRPSDPTDLPAGSLNHNETLISA